MSRRGSIVFPVVLIAVGTLFLVNNLRPDLSLLSLISTYWPLLFVIWGGLRLMEIAFIGLRGGPLPSAGITGGEWTLAVLVFLLGAGLNATQHLASRWPEGIVRMRGLEVFGTPYDFPISATHPAPKNARIVIENLRGNVRVVGAETQELRLTGRKIVRAIDFSSANEADRQTPLELVENAGSIIVRTNQSRLGSPVQISADLEITAPAGATVEARGRYGDYDISGIRGGIEIISDNAGVRLHDVGGNIRVDLRRSDVVRVVNAKGDLEVRGRGSDIEAENVDGRVTVNGSFSGDILFRKIRGPLTFNSPVTELSAGRVDGQLRFDLGDLTANDLGGALRVRSRSKDVQVTDGAEVVEIELQRGDITIRQTRTPVPRTVVSTGTGDIELALPEKGSFELKATTERGGVENGFGSALKVDTTGGGATIEGRLGRAGAPRVEATTRRGSIRVRPLAGVLAPPAQPSVPEPPAQPKPVRAPEGSLELQRH